MRVAALIALAVATSSVGSTASAAVQYERPLNLVVLGDSYSAGNGAGDYYGPFGCSRSHSNWAERYRLHLGAQGVAATVTNRACSGAATRDVLNPHSFGTGIYLLPGWNSSCPPAQYPEEETLTFAFRIDFYRVVCERTLRAQIDAVPTADIVLLTLGGNDVHFATIIIQCFLLRIGPNCRDNVESAFGRLPELKESLKTVLTRLNEVAAPHAKIVLIGYPYLERRDSFVFSWLVPGGVESYPVGARVRELGHEGDRMQREAIAEVFGSDVGKRAFFVDGIAAKFAGHEPDATFSNVTGYVSDAWLHDRFNLLDVTAMYHPNPAGQQAYSEVVGEYGTFAVSLPPPLARCVVPAVKGALLRAARARIIGAHCRVGTIKHVRSNRRKGVVLAQNPSAGRSLPEGTRVNLVVSRGRRL